MRQTKAMYRARVRIGITAARSLGLTPIQQCLVFGYRIKRSSEFQRTMRNISANENFDVSERVGLLVRIHTSVYNSCGTRAKLRAWKRQRVDGHGHDTVGTLLGTGHKDNLKAVLRHMVIAGHA